ncbi:hypothetical protein DP939_14020 [Spongiactinospora rosea]|uniref:Uncharacterized protein n=1 Tax=Spongiactinospora rosea TaxID=2248750 RepID=A0A366M0U7_9ACTN|nr:hypothetical protein DP939_14020 [Spongiactinospora rosea]
MRLQEWWRHRQAEAMQQDVAPAWYATRARRHALVGAHGVALALLWAAAVLWLFSLEGHGRWGTMLIVAGLVIAVPTISLLNLATRGTTALAEESLDERQLADRMRAMATAHRGTMIMLALVAAGALATGLAAGHDLSLPVTGVLQLTITIGLTHMMLPLLVSAWRLPDPPAEDA